LSLGAALDFDIAPEVACGSVLAERDVIITAGRGGEVEGAPEEPVGLIEQVERGDGSGGERGRIVAIVSTGADVALRMVEGEETSGAELGLFWF
jgi:hypothetical protein